MGLYLMREIEKRLEAGEPESELAALRARVAELEALLRDAHGHLGDYCDENEQAGFRHVAKVTAELLARIEAAVGVAGNKTEVPK